MAGLANSVWSALIGLAVVPFYLKYLGIEAYGLIGFFVTTQTLLQLLDMGMAPTINREVARCSASGDLKEAGKLLHTLAIIYWCMAGVIALLILALAPWIAEYWLQSKQLSPQIISHAVMLIGLVVACRWPIGLYQGALIGAQRLTVSSGINMAMVTIGSLGAVAVLAFISPTIEAFFIWQACVGIVYAITIRAAAWRIIGDTKANHFDADYIRRILKFSLGVGAISFSGIVLTQLDKVILSKTLGLESFGKYMLATMVANSLYILIVPIFNTAYPKFSSLVAQEKLEELFMQYRTASHLLATMLFPLAMVMVLLSQQLIQLWTGNGSLAADVAPLASLLLIGYALHGVMHMPYALMLAQGETRSMLKIYVSLIVIIVPLTAVLSLMYGAVGGALAQLLLFVFYVLMGTWITHKRYFIGFAREWLLIDVGVPLGISLLIGLLGFFILSMLGAEVYVKLMVGLVLWGVATLLSIYSSQFSRSIFVGYWNQFRYR
ncbi:lipopolysaccharide biosynthesis protein [Sulfuriferula nivalis]|uniref:Polysaccharide biosynthesis protein n=1 Tax=Sulfuriferula nivalis TaxID=2675298 RepID=A0A809RE50_9PROT|nr:oligosaccharide flippase family protein [Sulfuriferula nivalis]BBO99915.1 polysaccharide biosynthesis protein [Sulfuriferula nivalis]